MKKLRAVANGRWASTLATLLMLALLFGLIIYWAMQLLAPRVTIAPSGSLASVDAGVDTSSSRLLFGNADGKAAPTEQRRESVKVEVSGVLVSASRAAAILSIDGKPAQAYGVGQPIDEDDDFTIKSVSRDEVVLDRNGEEIRAKVPTGGDLAVLTSGQNEESATATPAATRRSRGRSGPGAAARSRVRQGQRSGANLPALAPRRLPPAGAAAASAAAKNTTGIPVGNTPAAGRPAGIGRPGNANKAGVRPAVRTRLGTPANPTMQNNQGGPADNNNGQNVNNQPGQAAPPPNNGQKPAQ